MVLNIAVTHQWNKYHIWIYKYKLQFKFNTQDWTHCPQDKLDNIFQRLYSKLFFSLKAYKFWLQLCWGFLWGIINTLRLRQNGRHFADDIFKYIFSNENVWILIKFSLKFVPKGPIHIIPAFVQVMAWRHPGDKPLSEPMMVCWPTHICVTRPQWVNNLSALVQVMA